jgi:hypothetical protein
VAASFHGFNVSDAKVKVSALHNGNQNSLSPSLYLKSMMRGQLGGCMSACQCGNRTDDVGAFHLGKAKGKVLRMSGDQQIRR